MTKLAALLVLTVAAVLGLFQAPAAAAGFVGELVPSGSKAPPPEVVAEVLAASAGDVLAAPEAPGPPATPPTPAASVTPAATAPPNTTTTAPPPAEAAAVLAPALQVAAGDPEPQPGRLEVLGSQEVAGRAPTLPPRSTASAGRAPPDGLAQTGASTDDVAGLGLGLIAMGSILCRQARGRRGKHR